MNWIGIVCDQEKQPNIFEHYKNVQNNNVNMYKQRYCDEFRQIRDHYEELKLWSLCTLYWCVNVLHMKQEMMTWPDKVIIFWCYRRRKHSQQYASSDSSSQSDMESHSGWGLVTHSPLAQVNMSSGHLPGIKKTVMLYI